MTEGYFSLFTQKQFHFFKFFKIVEREREGKLERERRGRTGHRQFSRFPATTDHTRRPRRSATSKPVDRPSFTANGRRTRRDRAFFRRAAASLSPVISLSSDLRFAHRRSHWVRLLAIYKTPKFHGHQPPDAPPVTAESGEALRPAGKSIFRRPPRPATTLIRLFSTP